MSTTVPRAGDYVRPLAERAAERGSLTFVLFGQQQVLLKERYVTPLGIKLEEARAAGRCFAEVLQKVTTHLTDRSRDLAVTNRAVPAHEPLWLTPAESETYLEAIRELGAPLRASLSAGVSQRLRHHAAQLVG